MKPFSSPRAVASRTFRYSELRTGDWVEVRGVEASAARTADALVVERRAVPQGLRIEFEAPVGSLANPNLTIAGVVVSTANAEFRDRAGAVLTRGRFCGQASGDVVGARGAYSGATFVADSVSLRP
ncbi:MAG: hypothetical protein ACK53C_11640 [Pseudomonadota bacterium]|jgi:hypothetical protein